MSTVRMSDQLQRDIAREAINTYDKANPERESLLIWVTKCMTNI